MCIGRSLGVRFTRVGSFSLINDFLLFFAVETSSTCGEQLRRDGNPKFVGTLIRKDEHSRGRHTSLPPPLLSPFSLYSITKSFWSRCIAVMRFVNNGSRNWTRRPPAFFLVVLVVVVAVAIGRRRRTTASQVHLRDWTRLLLRLNRKLKVSAASPEFPPFARDRRRLWLRAIVPFPVPPISCRR